MILLSLSMIMLFVMPFVLLSSGIGRKRARRKGHKYCKRVRQRRRTRLCLVDLFLCLENAAEPLLFSV